MNGFISATQAAKILKLTRQSITRLIRKGELKAIRPLNAGKTTGYKIKLDDVYALIQKRNAPKTEKKCPRCGKTKSLVEFNRCRTRKNGHAAYCRECRKAQYRENKKHILAQKKEYWRENKDRLRERQRNYYAQHRDEINANRREQYSENKADILAAKRERYASDPEHRKRRKQASREYREAHPEKAKQAARNYYWKNKERLSKEQKERYRRNRKKRLEYNHKYYNLHSDRIKQQSAEWRQNNPDKRAAYNAKRRAKKKNQDIDAKPIDRQSIIERDDATCYICGTSSLDDSEIHLDHIIPLNQGGSHTPDNLKVACQSCNCKKADKTLDEVLDLIEQGLFF